MTRLLRWWETRWGRITRAYASTHRNPKGTP